MEPSLQFVLFVRSGCPLCEAMEAELGPFIQEHAISVVRRYIDNDESLQQRYGEKIPVLTLNDETLCEYFLDPERLLEAIDTACKKDRRS